VGTKTEEEAYRTLPDEAIAVLSRLPRVEGSPWVFPGKQPSQHRKGVRTLWNRIRERAGLLELEDLGSYRLHDLRHNAVSWDVSRGVSLKIAGASVGHKSQRSTEVYAHFLPNHLKDATNSRARAMREAAGVGDGAGN
jgi:integrase